MTPQQKYWIKYWFVVLTLIGTGTLFANLGFQYFSLGLAVGCAILVRIFLWGSVWSGVELSQQETKRQYLHEAIGFVFAMLVSLLAQVWLGNSRPI